MAEKTRNLCAEIPLELHTKVRHYWREHPLSLEECLAQFKRLREQRLARESKLQG